MFLERTPEGQRGFDAATAQEYGIDKELLAMRTIEDYSGLQRAIGHEKAAEEMATSLGEYVLAGELNSFEADMIATLSILGNVATFALNEVERLRDGSQAPLGE